MPDGTASPVSDLERERELNTPLNPHVLLPRYREPRCALDCLLYFRPPPQAFAAPTPDNVWPAPVSTPAPVPVPVPVTPPPATVTAMAVDGDASQTTPTPSSPSTPTPSNPYPTVAPVDPVPAAVTTPSPLASLIATVAESLDAHGIDHFSVTLSPTLLGLLDHRLQWAVADTAAQRRYAWENKDSAFLQQWIADVEGIHRAAALVAVAAASSAEESDGGDGAREGGSPTSPTGSPSTPTAHDYPPSPPRPGTLGTHDWAALANRWLGDASHFDRPHVPRGTWQLAPFPSMAGPSTCHIALRPPYAQTANLPWSDTERARLLRYYPGGTVTHTHTLPPLCPQYVCNGLASGMSTWQDNVTSDTPFQCTPKGGGGGWAAQWARSEQVFAGARPTRKGERHEALAPTLAALLDLSDDAGYTGDVRGGLFRVLETLVTTLRRMWAPEDRLGFGIRVVRDEEDGLRLDLPFKSGDKVGTAFVAQHCGGGGFAGLETALMYLVLTVGAMFLLISIHPLTAYHRCTPLPSATKHPSPSPSRPTGRRATRSCGSIPRPARSMFRV